MASSLHAKGGDKHQVLPQRSLPSTNRSQQKKRTRNRILQPTQSKRHPHCYDTPRRGNNTTLNNKQSFKNITTKRKGLYEAITKNKLTGERINRPVLKGAPPFQSWGIHAKRLPADCLNLQNHSATNNWLQHSGLYTCYTYKYKCLDAADRIAVSPTSIVQRKDGVGNKTQLRSLKVSTATSRRSPAIAIQSQLKQSPIFTSTQPRGGEATLHTEKQSLENIQQQKENFVKL